MKESSLMRTLLFNLTTDQANACGLILSSSGILYHVKKSGKRWEIWVEEAEYDNALDCIKQYFEENPDLESDIEPDIESDIAPVLGPIEAEFQKTYTGIWAAVFLLGCYVLSTAGNEKMHYVRQYGASAVDILHGEWYRLVTALMLHADSVHLLGNMVGIAVFGTAVCGITGWGVGWLLILVTGILGNLLNAALMKTGHVSIGASTAIFGAVGLLAGYQFLKLYKISGKRVRAWLPLGGGIALLGFLGSGEHSDLTAHLFGFVSGIVLGILYAYKKPHRPDRSVQRYCIIILSGILALAWLSGF